MRPIKITIENRAVISAALLAANGKATAHTARVDDIYTLAVHSEKWVLRLLGSKKNAVGSEVWWRSGKALPNAYRYTRRVTGVTLQRKSRDWWLVSARADDARRDAGGSQLMLTPRQDTLAKKKFGSQYRVSTI